MHANQILGQSKDSYDAEGYYICRIALASTAF